MPLLLRREEYLKKVVDMPNISLGLTPPLGEEPVLADVVNISSHYQDVGVASPQAANPSSTCQEKRTKESC